MLIKHVLRSLWLLLLWGGLSQAQTIRGRVVAETGEPLQAYVYLKDRGLVVAFELASEKGEFTIAIPAALDSVWLEVSHLGYASYLLATTTRELRARETAWEVVLSPQPFEMEELVVSEVRPIVTRGDTTEYNLKAFRTGEERNVEDLLRKLPGLEVAPDGKLKFKGKPVEQVQLDGDDLFGHRYQLGTRNLAADQVEKVQAIDNFSDNPVLAGLSKSGSTALNLVLKKQRPKINLDWDSGLGAGEKPFWSQSATFITLAGRFKSFANLSANNIGSINYFYDNSVRYTSYMRMDASLLNRERIVPLNTQQSMVASASQRINNEQSGGATNLLRLSDRVTLHLNGFGSTDRLLQYHASQRDFLTSATTFIDSTSTVLRSRAYDLTGKLVYNDSRKVYATLQFSSIQSLNRQSTEFFNQYQLSSLNTSLLQDPELYVKSDNSLRIKGKQALRLRAEYHQNAYHYALAATRVGGSEVPLGPTIRHTNSDLMTQLLYYKRYEKTTMTHSLGSYQRSSRLGQSGEQPLPDLPSPLGATQKYQHRSVFYKGGLNLRKGLFSIDPLVEISYNEALLSSPLQTDTDTRLAFLPQLEVEGKFSSRKTLTAEAKRLLTPTALQYLPAYAIFDGTRGLISNVPSAQYILEDFVRLDYKYVIPNVFSGITVGAELRRTDGNWVPDYQIAQEFFVTQFRFLSIRTSERNAFLRYEVLIPALRLNIKSINRFSQYNYFNSIEEGTLRNNRSHAWNHTLMLISSLNQYLTYENKLTYSHFDFFVDARRAGTQRTLRNELVVKVFPYKNSVFLTAKYIHIRPELSQVSQMNFMDVELLYKPPTPKNLLEYHLTGSNILNQRSFSAVRQSDFDVVNNRQVFLGRYVMGTVKIRL